MTLPIYPTLPGSALPQKWMPRFYNMATQTTASGADIDLGLAEYPLHDFERQYNFLRSTNGQVEFQTLMGFILQVGGSSGRFLYTNPDDTTVTGHLIAVGDGLSTTFPIVRTFGAGGFGGTEPVGMVDLTQAFNVKVNGSLKTLGSDYTIDQTVPGLNTITFASPVGNTSLVTVDMTYRYYCKFPDNTQEFDKFGLGLFSMPKLAFHSCRPGA